MTLFLPYDLTRQAEWMDLSTTSTLYEVDSEDSAVLVVFAANKDSGGQQKKRSISPNQQRSSSFSSCGL